MNSSRTVRVAALLGDTVAVRWHLPDGRLYEQEITAPPAAVLAARVNSSGIQGESQSAPVGWEPNEPRLTFPDRPLVPTKPAVFADCLEGCVTPAACAEAGRCQTVVRIFHDRFHAKIDEHAREDSRRNSPPPTWWTRLKASVKRAFTPIGDGESGETLDSYFVKPPARDCAYCALARAEKAATVKP
jgi:hypothetical protein